MLNLQPPEKVIASDGALIDLHSLFYTIQGEGPHSGRPAVFIRLAGCNLQCPNCDTLYTTGRVPEVSMEVILNHVNNYFRSYTPLNPRAKRGLIVITGGEPFRQNILRLVNTLIGVYDVQIETNGTLPPPDGLTAYADIVCSPKTSTVNKKLLPRITAYKYVISAESVSDVDGLPVKALSHNNAGKVARPHVGFLGPIYIQPEDMLDKNKNIENLKACVQSCMKFGYTIQIQLHKFLGVE